MPDVWEEQFFDNLDQTAQGDPDSDGLNNAEEFEAGTKPDNADSDDDGYADGVETGTGTWVSAENTGTSPTKSDSDGDGLADGVENPDLGYDAENPEKQSGSDPNEKDSDGDSVPDGREIALGRDPSVPQAAPEHVQDFDGYPDGTTDLGDGSVIIGAAAEVVDGRLQLTKDGQGLGFSSWTIPAIANSSQGFTVTFDMEIQMAQANDPADGLFNYGDFRLGEQGQAEEGMFNDLELIITFLLKLIPGEMVMPSKGLTLQNKSMEQKKMSPSLTDRFFRMEAVFQDQSPLLIIQTLVLVSQLKDLILTLTLKMLSCYHLLVTIRSTSVSPLESEALIRIYSSTTLFFL